MGPITHFLWAKHRFSGGAHIQLKGGSPSTGSGQASSPATSSGQAGSSEVIKELAVRVGARKDINFQSRQFLMATVSVSKRRI